MHCCTVHLPRGGTSRSDAFRNLLKIICPVKETKNKWGKERPISQTPQSIKHGSKLQMPRAVVSSGSLCNLRAVDAPAVLSSEHQVHCKLFIPLLLWMLNPSQRLCHCWGFCLYCKWMFLLRRAISFPRDYLDCLSLFCLFAFSSWPSKHIYRQRCLF